MEKINLNSLENYIRDVHQYATDAANRRDHLVAICLEQTGKNLINLKVRIEAQQEITPEHVEQFGQMIDRAERLMYLGIEGQQ